MDSRKRVLTVVLVLAVTAATSLGYVWKAYADSSTVYYACEKSDGGIYMIPPTGNCKTGETQLSWNQQGPMGNVGPPGATGATGATGPQGPSGVSGYHVVSASGSCGGPGQCSISATCPTGESVLGGGYNIPYSVWTGEVIGDDGSNGVWTVTIYSTYSSNISWSVNAVCAVTS